MKVQTKTLPRQNHRKNYLQKCKGHQKISFFFWNFSVKSESCYTSLPNDDVEPQTVNTSKNDEQIEWKVCYFHTLGFIQAY